MGHSVGWCGFPMVQKKFDDMFSRFDTIPECDGQTGRYLATAADSIVCVFRSCVCLRQFWFSLLTFIQIICLSDRVVHLYCEELVRLSDFVELVTWTGVEMEALLLEIGINGRQQSRVPRDRRTPSGKQQRQRYRRILHRP